jgi:adenylate kinase
MMTKDKSKNTEEQPGGVGVVYPPVNEAGDVSADASHKAIILIGAPGCGKGTLTASFSSLMGFSVFSSGNALRAEVASGSELGQEIQKVCDSGMLVSDDMVLAMVKKFLEENRKGTVVFDGFPRTLPQARALSSLLDDWSSVVFYLQVDDNIVTDRMLGRYSCKSCGKLYNERMISPKVAGICDVCCGTEFVKRGDDNEEAIRTRLKVYYESTAPVLDYYREQGKVFVVDASSEPSVVSDEVLRIIFG